MKLCAGIDLHGKTLALAVTDERDRLPPKARLPLSMSQILAALELCREWIAGIAAESIYNWYWLVGSWVGGDWPRSAAAAIAFPGANQ